MPRVCENDWFRRGMKLAWLSCEPDLNPMDFFLWTYLNSSVRQYAGFFGSFEKECRNSNWPPLPKETTCREVIRNFIGLLKRCENVRDYISMTLFLWDTLYQFLNGKIVSTIGSKASKNILIVRRRILTNNKCTFTVLFDNFFIPCPETVAVNLYFILFFLYIFYFK